MYTSVIPNLLVDPISNAIRDTEAPVIYACNLMTKLGETDGYSCSMFARELVRYIGSRKLDYLLANTGTFSSDVLSGYAAEMATPVELDTDHAEKYAWEIVLSNMALVDGVKVRHNSETLARIVMSTV